MQVNATNSIQLTLGYKEATLLAHLLGSISMPDIKEIIGRDDYYTTEVADMVDLQNEIIDELEEVGIEL